MRLVDGTAASGTWSGLIYIPEQTPPGTYELTVIVNDATDFPKPIGRMTWFRPGRLVLEALICPSSRPVRPTRIRRASRRSHSNLTPAPDAAPPD